jgi:hypothetical protein
VAFSDTTITATNELSVTDGAGGPVFADVIPSGNKACILGKLGVGTLNLANTLDVAGGLSASEHASLAVSGEVEQVAGGMYETDGQGNPIIDTYQIVRSGFHLIDVPVREG